MAMRIDRPRKKRAVGGRAAPGVFDAYFAPRGFISAARNVGFAQGSSTVIPIAAGPGGLAYQVGVSSTVYLQAATGIHALPGPLTFVVVYALTATPAGSSRVAGTLFGGTSGYGMAPNATNYRALVSSGTATTLVGDAITVGRIVVDVLTIEGASGTRTFSYYQDGKLKATASGSYTADTARPLRIGPDHAAATSAASMVYGTALYDRALTAGEIAAKFSDLASFFAETAATRSIVIPEAAGASGPVASASITEAADTVTSAAVADLAASASIAEQADTTSSASATTLSAAASTTEQSDALASSAAAELAAAASVAEQDDSVSSALIGTSGINSNTVDEPDSVASAASAQPACAADIVEAGDIVFAAVSASLAAGASIADADDIVVSAVAAEINAAASNSEADDVLASTISTATGGGGATADEIWGYVLSNGLTAGETLAQALQYAKTCCNG